MAASLPPPAPPSPPLAADTGQPIHPIAASIAPSPPSSSLSLSPSLLIIAALLGFVFLASVSIHLLLRFLARPAPPLPRHRRTASSSTASSSVAAAAAAVEVGMSEAEEKEALIESLPLFTMASALAALPKSSPDCAVCLSPFLPDAELRLLPACRHAFHAGCVDAWLRTTPSCPLCRAAVAFPLPPLPVPDLQEPPRTLFGTGGNSSRSFRVEIGSISHRRSAAGEDDQAQPNRRTYSLGSFDYRVDEELEAVVSRITRAAKEAKQQPQPAYAGPVPPGEEVAEAAGSRGWLREYVDRLTSSASSFSGRWSARWSHRHDDSWRWWDPEATAEAAPASAPPPPPPARAEELEEEGAGLVALYRWIVGV